MKIHNATPTLIDLDKIMFSPTNPRDPKTSDVTDLVASIRKDGVLVPVIVRPHPDAKKAKDGFFELVAGHRRVMACQVLVEENLQETSMPGELAFFSMPAILRKLTDSEAMEVQVIENLQRKDLDPLEEAAGLDRLWQSALRRDGTDRTESPRIEHIAAAVGKSTSYVARRLQLLKVSPAVKKAYQEKGLPLGHMELLSRFDHISQDVMLKECFDAEWINGKNTELVVPLARLKDEVMADFMLVLSDAPFDLTDATLNPKMGACLTCEFRTGANAALFPDIKNVDKCLKSDCYEIKVKKDLDRKADAAAKERGVKKILRVGIVSPYHLTTEEKKQIDVFISHGHERILGKELCASAKAGIVVRNEERGKDAYKVGTIVNVCADKNCKTHAGKSSSHGSGSRAQKKTPAERMKGRIEKLKAGIDDAVEAQKLVALAAAIPTRPDISDVKWAAIAELISRYAFDSIYHDRMVDACKAFGLEPNGYQYDLTLKKHLTELGQPLGPLGVFLYTALMAMAIDPRHSDVDPCDELCKIYGVDEKAIRKQLEAEVNTKIEEIKAAAERAKAKAKATDRASAKDAKKATPNAGESRAKTKAGREGSNGKPTAKSKQEADPSAKAPQDDKRGKKAGKRK